MPEHSPSLSPAPIRTAGLRRITLDMRAKLDEADRFTGLPRGTAKPFALLAAFQQAEPYLGLPAHAYKLRVMAGQPDKAAGLGGRQPADRMAIGAAPAGVSSACPRGA